MKTTTTPPPQPSAAAAAVDDDDGDDDDDSAGADVAASLRKCWSTMSSEAWPSALASVSMCA